MHISFYLFLFIVILLLIITLNSKVRIMFNLFQDISYSPSDLILQFSFFLFFGGGGGVVVGGFFLFSGLISCLKRIKDFSVS